MLLKAHWFADVYADQSSCALLQELDFVDFLEFTRFVGNLGASDGLDLTVDLDGVQVHHSSVTFTYDLVAWQVKDLDIRQELLCCGAHLISRTKDVTSPDVRDIFKSHEQDLDSFTWSGKFDIFIFAIMNRLDLGRDLVWSDVE